MPIQSTLLIGETMARLTSSNPWQIYVTGGKEVRLYRFANIGVPGFLAIPKTQNLSYESPRTYEGDDFSPAPLSLRFHKRTNILGEIR